MKPIITSRWETDAYKLSMGQVFWQKYKGVWARYIFTDRSGLSYPPEFFFALREQIGYIADLGPDNSALDYLRSKWPFINPQYLVWFANDLKLNTDQVDIRNTNGKLEIVIEGPIEIVTDWEIKLLRTISTLYVRLMKLIPDSTWRPDHVSRMRELYRNGVVWAEFGGRRPFSPDIHWEALTTALLYKQTEKSGPGLIGTSWIEYAFQLGLMPIGTQAHEFTQFMAAMYGYTNANKMAMQTWVETFGTRLGYVLPDTYTTPVFLKDFVYGYADLFEGSRQDSGDPYKAANLMISHYRRLGIDHKSKSVIHSNSLRSVEEIVALNDYRKGEYKRSFGLGGFMTNNVGHSPFNSVIKLTAIKPSGGDWIDTVKLSDDPGKAIGNPTEVLNCKSELGIE